MPFERKKAVGATFKVIAAILISVNILAGSTHAGSIDLPRLCTRTVGAGQYRAFVVIPCAPVGP
jgi:hypothetical protein